MTTSQGRSYSYKIELTIPTPPDFLGGLDEMAYTRCLAGSSWLMVAVNRSMP